MKAKITLIVIYTCLMSIYSFGYTLQQNTDSLHILSYTAKIMATIDSLEKELEYQSVDLNLIREVLAHLDSTQVSPIGLPDGDSVFGSTDFKSHQRKLSTLLRTKDSLSYLLDSAYYFSSFGWNTTTKTDHYYSDQKVLASYFYLGNKVAKLIRNTNLSQDEQLRLKTGLNTSLSRLNGQLSKNYLSEAQSMLRTSPREKKNLEKLLFHLKAILQEEADFLQHLTSYAKYYEEYWNEQFLENIQDMKILDAMGLTPKEKARIAAYLSQIKLSEKLALDETNTLTSYILTHHWTSLLRSIQKGLYPLFKTFTSSLTDQIDTLDIYELSYLAKLYASHEGISALTDMAEDSIFSQTLTSGRLNLYKAQLKHLNEVKDYLQNDDNWSLTSFPFRVNISCIPTGQHSQKLRVDLDYKIRDSLYLNTGIYYDNIHFNTASGQSLEDLFTTYKKDNGPLLDKEKFIHFIEQLGFVIEFVEVHEPSDLTNQSIIAFSYFGKKVSWYIYFPKDLVGYQAKIAALKTAPKNQIEYILQETLGREVQKTVNQLISDSHKFIQSHLHLDWTAFNIDDPDIRITSDHATIKINLSQLSQQLIGSYAIYTFDKSGLKSANIQLSDSFYQYVLQTAFPGVIIDKSTESQNSFSMKTWDNRPIGEITFNGQAPTFTASENLTFDFPPSWRLNPGKTRIDFEHSMLTFEKATFTEELDYSRFDKIEELSGSISLSDSHISVSFSDTSKKRFSEMLINNLERWNIIPDGMKVKSIGITNGRLAIAYAIDDRLKDQIDSTLLSNLSQIGTSHFQSETYENTIKEIYQYSRQELADDLKSILTSFDNPKVLTFIEKYKISTDSLRLSHHTTAIIEARDNTLLKLAIYNSLISCDQPLFRITITTGNPPAFSDFNNTCLTGYAKDLMPDFLDIELIQSLFDQETTVLTTEMTASTSDFSATLTLTIGLDGNIRVDDNFMSEKEIFNHISDELAAHFEGKTAQLRDSLDALIYQRIQELESNYSPLISNMKVLKKGDLPYGVQFDLSSQSYDFKVENIQLMIDGTYDFSTVHTDMQAFRTTLNNYLNKDILTIDGLSFAMGKNLFDLHLTLSFHEKTYLNTYGQITAVVQLFDEKISLDFRQFIKNIGLPNLILGLIFDGKQHIQYHYDDLNFTLLRSQSSLVNEGLIKLYGEATVSNSPKIVIPVELYLPIDLSQKNKLKIKILTDEQAIIANIENSIIDQLPANWGELGVISLHSPRFIYNAKSIPTGISLEADLKLDFLEGVRVSLPQLIIDKDGLDIGDLNRIAFSIPLNIYVPPYFFLSSGYGEFAKEYMTIGGIMTIVPGYEMENIILMDGSFTYEFDNLLALRSNDEARLFRVISLGKQESVIDLKNGIFSRDIVIGGPFKDIIYFQGYAKVNAKKLHITAEGSLKIFDHSMGQSDIDIDLSTQAISASSTFNVIGQDFEGAFSSGTHFSSPSFTGKTSFSLLGVKLNSTSLTIEPDWADVTISAFGMKTGISAPSYNQLSLSKLKELLKRLLEPDLDIEEAISQILKGNFKVNPFSDFGDSGKGGGSGGNSGQGSSTGNGASKGGMKGNHGQSQRTTSSNASGNNTGNNAATSATNHEPSASTTRGNDMTQNSSEGNETSQKSAFGTVNGTYASKLHIRKQGGTHHIYDGNQKISKIPSAIKKTLLSNGKIDPDKAKIITVDNSGIFFIANDDYIHAFLDDYHFKTKDISSILRFSTISQSLKNNALKSNLLSFLRNGIYRKSESSTPDQFRIFEKQMIYYQTEGTLIYYTTGRKKEVDNQANIPPTVILSTETQQ